MGWSVFDKIKKISTIVLIIPVVRFFWRLIRIFSRQNKKNIAFFHTEKVFYDNSRYLFEHLLKNGEENAFLLLKNKKLYVNLLPVYPGKVYLASSFKGMQQFRKTQNIVISYGTSVMEFFPFYLDPVYQNIIYLGHGIPMKKIGRQVSRWQSPFYQKLLQPYTFASCSSLLEKFILASSFQLKIDNVWVTGSPRNDVLFEYAGKKNLKISSHPFQNRKVILYAPTWREFGNTTRFFPFPDFDAEKLLHFLESKDILLLLRGHKEEIKNAGGLFSGNPVLNQRIMPANQDIFPDVVELLPYVDVLITDYSGMYFDFLPFNKPIVFIPYDLEQYNKYKGILFPYNEFMAGQKTLTQSDFVEVLEKCLAMPGELSDKRLEMTRLFYRYQDSMACERIYQNLKILTR